ncbi:PP2C family protein-serine/threonine phosphatase [Terracidiphilus gabretensis]|uniref:PP2C family protein-serine/threonine phosphatase n=1 Tax=Terracidiphilus gabretensis TaxID=1577687 RepID=UPI00071BAE84|nr:PP2C family protein-serine/threonine phosphatase [Terracidiphilus gabretensis]
MPADFASTRSLWTNVPRKNLVIFLIAVFFTFAVIGIIGDVSGMGYQSPLHFACAVLVAGPFAVGYAYSGIALRGKSWRVAIPLFILQFAVMALLGYLFPEPRRPSQLNTAETERLQTRLNFDVAAIAVAVSLGYSGFVYVFVQESRRHIRILTEKAVLDSEMQAARAVQHLILPESNETFAGFHVDSVYTPAQQVGGDFFQILSDGAGGILIVIGDVAGKGLSAAMLVSMLVGIIRATAEETHDPARILRKLHGRLLGSAGEGFSTALAAHIANDGLVTVANAGHLSPYLNGEEIDLPGALPLGVSAGGDYQSIAFTLPPGGRLTFYTDGVVEARNQAGELFGFDRAQAISTHTATAITKAAIDFGQEDDITVATIERLPA